MKQLSNLASVCGGLLFVSVCVGLITAGPSLAQGGRPPSDVNVVNTPNVNVLSVPAVQIGNGAANPVPVNVTNLPGEQAASEPITIEGEFLIDAAYLGNQVPAYTVPAGKRLVIEFVSVTFSEEVERDHQFEFFIFESVFSTFSVYFDMDGKFFSNTGGSHLYQDRATKQVQVFAEPGNVVNFLGRRSTSGATGNCRFTLTGHLLSVP